MVHVHLLLLFLSSLPLFFFNDTATTDIYTLSLHDALPICHQRSSDFKRLFAVVRLRDDQIVNVHTEFAGIGWRSEEHTSELQSRGHLVCRLLLEKKKNRSAIQFKTYHIVTTTDRSDLLDKS